MEKIWFKEESCRRNRDAVWLGRARIDRGIDEVVVASKVNTESPAGVVVPIDDCVVPLTPPATCAKRDDDMSWRGESVSKELPFDETSTWR